MQLKPGESYTSYYSARTITNTTNGVEIFLGTRKDLNPPNTGLVERELLKFDPRTMEVSRVLSEAALAEFLPSDEHVRTNIKEISATPDGRFLAITRINSEYKAIGQTARGLSTDVMWRNLSSDILILDVEGNKLVILVRDGRRNHTPAISPDGKYVAFFSTDSDLGVISGKYSFQNAGLVVEKATHKVTQITQPYHWAEWGMVPPHDPPHWVDVHRVLFSTESGDPLSSPGSEEVYLAIANVDTSQTSRLILKKPFEAALDLQIDQGQKRIFYRNLKQVVQTGFDLKEINILVEAPPGKLIPSLSLVNGEPKYQITDVPTNGRERLSAIEAQAK